ncbi:hypothetical protein ACFRQM_09545 [Streptomyces sp. NPDC056831]|uniref:hypothetical protein n=1 Tax=Streptomyces sp. NPDC056831 TaxID=3345954 RepID=UPI00367B0E0A
MRAQIRAIKGIPAPTGTCQYSHDQAVHGKFERDGTSYCGVCKSDQRRASRTRAATPTSTGETTCH